MNKTIHLLAGYLLFLASFLLLGCKAEEPVKPAQQTDPETNEPADTTQTDPATTVYLVRHAEKGNDHLTNPSLSAAGQARAQELSTLLKNDSIAALFSTAYKRTTQTLQPLADLKTIAITTYQPNELGKLAENIRQNYVGKTVVIAGHSNTVLETIEAFGAARPVQQILESEYNYLFKLIIKPDSTMQVQTSRYGN